MLPDGGRAVIRRRPAGVPLRVRVGVREIDGRLVCEAHGRRLAAIRYCDQP